MRIAIIAPPWVSIPPDAYGGIEVVLDGLVRALDCGDDEVLLFATGDSTCPVQTGWAFERAVGVANARPAAELHHVVRAYDWLAGEVDIVHDHTLVGPVYAQRFASVPVVTTNHGPFAGELAGFYRSIDDVVPILAISHHQASTAHRTSVAGVIHHGVDVTQFPVGEGDGGYAAFVGRMCPDKGVHTAIAIARAADVPLKIAAKMDEAAEHRYFAERIEPLLGGDIEFVGEVGGSDKLALLGGACCLLNPIAWPEPFGMVMIEALACATPVLATPLGAVPEIVDDGITGFIRAEIPELADALRRTAELDRDACRTAAATRFSTARMAADHIRFYQSVLESHHRRDKAA